MTVFPSPNKLSKTVTNLRSTLVTSPIWLKSYGVLQILYEVLNQKVDHKSKTIQNYLDLQLKRPDWTSSSVVREFGSSKGASFA